jgi:hypothetical protein
MIHGMLPGCRLRTFLLRWSVALVMLPAALLHLVLPQTPAGRVLAICIGPMTPHPHHPSEMMATLWRRLAACCELKVVEPVHTPVVVQRALSSQCGLSSQGTWAPCRVPSTVKSVFVITLAVFPIYALALDLMGCPLESTPCSSHLPRLSLLNP